MGERHMPVNSAIRLSAAAAMLLCGSFLLTTALAKPFMNDGLDKKIACPLLALWGEKSPLNRPYDVLALWRDRASMVSGKALPGLELYVSKSVASDDFASDDHYVVTDSDGRCTIRGLPLEGAFAIRRDARLVVRGVPANADNPRRYQFPPDPLFALTLTKSMPDVIEQTVRIDAEGKPRHVFGQLRPEFLAVGSSGDEPAEIRFATKQGDPKWSRDIDKVPFDEQGRWTLDVVPDSEYRIWIERSQYRVSQIASVKIESDDVGIRILHRLLPGPVARSGIGRDRRGGLL